MRIRLIPALAVLYYAAMIFFVTYPGYVPFDRIRPFVLGMPFSMFWQVCWIVGAGLVLGGVFVWEQKRRGKADGARPTASEGGD
jgi:hypothetical protein